MHHWLSGANSLLPTGSPTARRTPVSTGCPAVSCTPVPTGSLQSTIHFIASAIQLHYNLVNQIFLHFWQANCTDEKCILAGFLAHLNLLNVSTVIKIIPLLYQIGKDDQEGLASLSIPSVTIDHGKVMNKTQLLAEHCLYSSSNLTFLLVQLSCLNRSSSIHCSQGLSSDVGEKICLSRATTNF